MSNDPELLAAAKLHAEAVQIIAMAIQDMGHPSLKRKDYENNAVAILARLAHANILLDRYDAKSEVRIEKAERLEHALKNIQIQVDENSEARKICDRALSGEFYP
jgi:hypothetical protein